MSDTVTLKARIREQVGSRVADRLRQQGQLPMIVYGHQKPPVSVAVDAHEFAEALHHGRRIFEMDLDGQKQTLLVKSIQYDYLGKTVIHADMMRVDLSERVRVQVAIKLRGTAKGTTEGGIVDEVLSQVEVECTVREIPQVLPVNIKDLALGQAIRAGQIELPAGVTLVTGADVVVALCHEPKAVVEPTAAVEGVEGAAAAPAEPEVITEKKPEEPAAE